MSPIIWNESYSVHNSAIDDQHKTLFEIFRKLHVQCDNNDLESLKEALLELLRYTVYHFKAEEIYMVDVSYRGIIMHRIEHNYFIKRIQEVIDLQDNRSAHRLRILITFLSSWLVQHVMGEDKKIPVTATVGKRPGVTLKSCVAQELSPPAYPPSQPERISHHAE